ncbi:MAG TPA: hypothetical protein VJY83_08820 [Thiopseudomonas sp.]|nr:hypothetical protein [Thiopseudomonas sp.]
MSRFKFLFLVFAFFMMAGCEALKTENKLVYFASAKPLWLAGVQNENLAYTKEYPQAVETAHFKVVNAGFWMFIDKDLKSILAYEYTLSVTKAFTEPVYMKITLDNPADPSSPFIYESVFQPENKTSSVRHNPVTGVRLGAQYKLVLEVFSDADLQNQIEKVEQIMISPVDNSTGAIVLSEEYKNTMCRQGAVGSNGGCL